MVNFSIGVGGGRWGCTENSSTYTAHGEGKRNHFTYTAHGEGKRNHCILLAWQKLEMLQLFKHCLKGIFSIFCDLVIFLRSWRVKLLHKIVLSPFYFEHKSSLECVLFSPFFSPSFI